MFDHKDLPSECFTQYSFSWSNLDWVRFLLGITVDGNSETTSSDFPPIVFENDNPAFARGVFRNDVLFKVCISTPTSRDSVNENIRDRLHAWLFMESKHSS